jgi:predicted metal-dependent peptidase
MTNQNDILLKELIDNLSAKMLKNDVGAPFGLSMISTNIRNYPVSNILPTIAFWNPVDDSFNIDVEAIKDKAEEKGIDEIIFLVSIVMHEISHRVLDHDNRKGERIHAAWNIATDIFINSYFLKTIWPELDIKRFKNIDLDKIDFENVYHITDGVIDDEKEFKNKYEEEIYRKIMDENDPQFKEEEIEIELEIPNDERNDNQNDQQDQQNNGQSNGSNSKIKVKAKITKYKDKVIDVEIQQEGLPQEITDKIEENMDKKLSNDKLANQIMKENIRKRGFGSALGQHILDGLTKVKIPWEKVLKDSLLTSFSKTDELGWSKIRKSSMTWDMYFPDYIEEESVECVIIAIDESGSMSDDELKKGLSIVLDLSDMYDKIIIMKHDFDVTDVKEFENVKDDKDGAKNQIIEFAKNRKASGGTSHKDVFEKIRDEYGKKYDISTILLFTDGYSDIQSHLSIIDRWKRSTFLLLPHQDSINVDLNKIYIE